MRNEKVTAILKIIKFKMIFNRLMDEKKIVYCKTFFGVTEAIKALSFAT